MPFYPDNVEYSNKYYDKVYEYRHVIMTKDFLRKIPVGRIMSENEWRSLGIQQSKGWENYYQYKKEPHVILFRRPIGTNPETGEISNEIKQRVEEYECFKEEYWG